jgi:hypothetical protein
MTLEAARANSCRSNGAGGLVLPILVTGLIGVGAGAWHPRAASPFDSEAGISIPDVLGMKRMKEIGEAWLERVGPDAGTRPVFVRDGRAFRFVYAAVPPADLGHPAGSNELKSDLDPSRMTVIRQPS